jgi:hypothetical protein
MYEAFGVVQNGFAYMGFHYPSNRCKYTERENESEHNFDTDSNLKIEYDRNRQEGEQEVGSDVDDYRMSAEVHTALV